MTAKLLDVENLTMKFGGLVAIDNLSFSAAKDQITSIIGPKRNFRVQGNMVAESKSEISVTDEPFEVKKVTNA